MHIKASESTLLEAPGGELKTVFSKRTARLTGVRMIASGSYVPDNMITSESMEQRLGLEPGWAKQRTGILERRHVSDGQATSDLAVEAGRRALHNAGLAPEQIDLLVVGTFTPDYLCPSTANLVQYRLGVDAPAFDIAAACSGFMYAMATAAQYIATGNARYAMVIGADTNSRIVNQNDPKIAPLFGDGAGAVILTQGHQQQGLVAYQLGSDGSGGPMLYRHTGGSMNELTPESLAQGRHYLQMDGRNVFKWAVRAVAETMQIVAEAAEISLEDVDYYLLHQANMRILDATCKTLGISNEKLINNLDRYGNTSAASIPLLIDDLMQAGRLETGDTLMMSGFGGGLTWGTGLFRW